MEDKKVDAEIKESIVKNTEETSKNKEEIWRNIESRLGISEESNNNLNKTGEKFMNSKQRVGEQAKTKIKSKGWITGTVAAAILIGLLSVNTNTGQAFINNVKEYFAPQKQVVDEIEGMPDEKEVTLKEGKAGYIIYIDEERYKMVQDDSIDKILPKEPLDEKFPVVSMEISQVTNKSPEELAHEIQQELKNKYQTVKEITSVNEPVEGLLVSAIDGDQWNSPITQVYIISNKKEGSFLIQQKYFLEAAEGHGARFHHMLKEFRIVETTED